MRHSEPFNPQLNPEIKLTLNPEIKLTLNPEIKLTLNPRILPKIESAVSDTKFYFKINSNFEKIFSLTFQTNFKIYVYYIGYCFFFGQI